MFQRLVRSMHSSAPFQKNIMARFRTVSAHEGGFKAPGPTSEDKVRTATHLRDSEREVAIENPSRASKKQSPRML